MFLIAKHRYETKLDRSRFLSALQMTLGYFGDGWPALHNPIKPDDVVFAYKPESEIPRCRLIVQQNEVKPKRFWKEMGEIRPELVVFHHLNEHDANRNRLQQLGIRSCHIPHVADPRFFRVFGQKKQYDFSLAGATCPKVYPLRSLFLEAMELLTKRGFRCRVIPHPGHEFAGAWRCDHLVRFAKAVNESRITGFCSSVYKYRLAKYVEVPACGSVVAADIPIQETRQPGMIECNPDESPTAIANRIEDALKSDAIDELQRQGIEYARSLTPTEYCRRLREFL